MAGAGGRSVPPPPPEFSDGDVLDADVGDLKDLLLVTSAEKKGKASSSSSSKIVSVEEAKNMSLSEQQACVMYMVCSSCSTRLSSRNPCPIFHRVCDMVQDRGKGTRLYLTCAKGGTRAMHGNEERRQERRENQLTASTLFSSFKGVERYSLDALEGLVAMFMRRDDVAPLWASGSAALTYWFFWTCETAEGWRASPEQVNDAERLESTNWLRSSPNPLLRAREHGGVRKVAHRDIHFAGTPVKILRVAYGVVKEDAGEMERIGCRLTKRTIGFAGNRRDGGTGTRIRNGNLHGVSILVIKDFAAIDLVLNEDYRASYEATRSRFGGSEGVALPAEPPPSFVAPPRDDTGAFVLGGSLVLAARGLGGAAAAEAAASFVASQEDEEEELVEWDGSLDGRNVYFSRKTPSSEQIASISRHGGKCFLTNVTLKNPMGLLIVDSSHCNWRETAKVEHAISNDVPVASFEELDEVLAGEEFV
ncbi:hypothetical protein RI054_30g121550 [Pseudoscourfieldia marina]